MVHLYLQKDIVSRTINTPLLLHYFISLEFSSLTIKSPTFVISIKESFN
nr:MAG TPA: hypothetical protein [Crassvirales sp.]